jgi:hypothetical protein
MGMIPVSFPGYNCVPPTCSERQAMRPLYNSIVRPSGFDLVETGSP